MEDLKRKSNLRKLIANEEMVSVFIHKGGRDYEVENYRDGVKKSNGCFFTASQFLNAMHRQEAAGWLVMNHQNRLTLASQHRLIGLGYEFFQQHGEDIVIRYKSIDPIEHEIVPASPQEIERNPKFLWWDY